MHFSNKAHCQCCSRPGNANQNGLPTGPRAGGTKPAVLFEASHMQSFKLNKLLYLAIFVCLAPLTPSDLAQAVYGSIFGTVTDNTGAVIPNAQITVTDIAKGTAVQAQSDASGDYRVQHLIPDSYRVDVEAPG